MVSNIPDHPIELDKLAQILIQRSNVTVYSSWVVIFDIYAQRKNFILRKKLNAANITGSWAKKVVMILL